MSYILRSMSIDTLLYKVARRLSKLQAPRNGESYEILIRKCIYAHDPEPKLVTRGLVRKVDEG